MQTWKQGRSDLADHFFAQLESQSHEQHQSRAQEIVEALYEIGRFEFEQQRFDLSISWLRRAYTLLENYERARTCFESEDLSLNVKHTYIEALLATDDSSCYTEAARLLKILKETNGHKLVVMVLQLELAVRDPNLDPKTLFEGLSTVIRHVHLIESNHNRILFYLHHLRRLDCSLAILCLKNYIEQRLVLENDCPLTEGAIVNLIWMSTDVQDLECLPDGQGFLNWLENIRKIWKTSLSAEASHGAFVVSSVFVNSRLMADHTKVALEGH